MPPRCQFCRLVSARSFSRVLPLLVLSACRSAGEWSWPFPEVDADVLAAARRGDASPVIAVLRERVANVETLYAELTMTIEGGERSGVFDTVVHYRAPHRLRITAFRDLVVSTRDVFDLALSKSRYVLGLDQDGEWRTHRGPIRDLGAAGDGFEVFRLLGERIFLPGRVDDEESVRIDLVDDTLSVTVTTASREVTWTLDARTLGVRTAVARELEGEAKVDIEYLGYRHVHGVYLPERFRLLEASGISVSGWLREVEVNAEMDAGVLEDPFNE